MRPGNLALAFAALFLADAALGQVIYDNGGPNHTAGLDMTGPIQAENFTLTSDASLCGVHFWSFDSGTGFSGSIVWTIYSDGFQTTQPGNILARGTAFPVHTLTGDVVAGFEESKNDFDIPCLPLPAGTYWLGLHNGPLTQQSNFSQFFWEVTDPNGTPPGNDDTFPFDDGIWQGQFQERAFNLTTSGATSVPEPGAAIMLGGFLIAGSLLYRRRQS